jgi:transcriptional regulator with XRE-family HTH domain
MKTLTRQLRTEQGLSQKALAQKALVTPYTIHVLEGLYPAQTVEPQNIQKVANALGVSMEVLLLKKTRREEELEQEVGELNGKIFSIRSNTIDDSKEITRLAEWNRSLEKRNDLLVLFLKLAGAVILIESLILIF